LIEAIATPFLVLTLDLAKPFIVLIFVEEA
jgi:hypothetical protein